MGMAGTQNGAWNGLLVFAVALPWKPIHNWNTIYLVRVEATVNIVTAQIPSNTNMYTVLSKVHIDCLVRNMWFISELRAAKKHVGGAIIL